MRKSFFFAALFLVTLNALPASLTAAPRKAVLKTPATKIADARPMHAAPRLASMVKSSAAPSENVLMTDAPTSEELEVIARTNAERTSRGLNALTFDPLLTGVARAHSFEMCARDYFDHHSPSAGQTTPMDRYLAALRSGGSSTPPYVLVGENIFFCSATSSTYNAAYGHRAFMNSPGHRANILEPRFAKMGVGIYRDANGQFWITEMFLRDTPPGN